MRSIQLSHIQSRPVEITGEKLAATNFNCFISAGLLQYSLVRYHPLLAVLIIIKQGLPLKNILQITTPYVYVFLLMQVTEGFRQYFVFLDLYKFNHVAVSFVLIYEMSIYRVLILSIFSMICRIRKTEIIQSRLLLWVVVDRTYDICF